jgi:hypothetical protein
MNSEEVKQATLENLRQDYPGIVSYRYCGESGEVELTLKEKLHHIYKRLTVEEFDQYLPDPTENKVSILIGSQLVTVRIYEQDGGIGGVIESDLHAKVGDYADYLDSSDEAYNFAIDGLESFLLAYACRAGVRALEEPNFVEALEVAVDGIAQAL